MKSPMQELLYQLRKEREESKIMPIEWRRCFIAIESIIQNNYISEEKKKFATAWQNGFETGHWIANTSGGWNGDGEDYYDQTFTENHIGEINEMVANQTAMEQFIEWIDSDCTPMDCVMKAKELLKIEQQQITKASEDTFNSTTEYYRNGSLDSDAPLFGEYYYNEKYGVLQSAGEKQKDLKEKLFNLANEFAVAKKGDIAILLHSIHNKLD